MIDIFIFLVLILMAYSVIVICGIALLIGIYYKIKDIIRYLYEFNI